MNGLLLIDKPEGPTSHDVVAILRRSLKQKAIGHTGTLDPLATGLMVMVLGDATKLSDYLISEDKAYQVRVRFGQTSDTLDSQGEILTRVDCALSSDEISEAVAALTGAFEWPVPLFSAAKVDGKKLCDLGRAGRAVDLPVKLMKFWNTQVAACGPDWVDVHLECSKGSFVRTWAAQLGERLGVGGLVETLRRTRVGLWRVDQALKLEPIRAEGLDLERARTTGSFILMSQALPGLKAVMAAPKEERLVHNGQIPRAIENRLIYEQKCAFEQGRSVFVKVLSDRGDLLAILAAEPGQGLRIKRVFRSFA